MKNFYIPIKRCKIQDDGNIGNDEVGEIVNIGLLSIIKDIYDITH